MKYHRKGDEILYEASLNDDVAKDGISALLDKIANTSRVEYKPLHAGTNGQIVALTGGSEKHYSAEDQTFEVTEKNQESTLDKVETSKEEFPHIADLEKTLDCGEQEWIAIYAFYESEYATNTFSRKAVYDRYMAKRRTEGRVRDFPIRWNRLSKHYFRTVNEAEVKFNQKKMPDIKNLILGLRKSEARSASGQLKKQEKPGTEGCAANGSKSKPKKTKAIQIEKFDLHKAGDIPSLDDFLKAKVPGKATANVIAVIAYYITVIKGAETFSEGNIDYAYRTLGLKRRPTYLHQILINAKNQQDFFEPADAYGVWRLTRTGEIFVEEKLPLKVN